jgi:hypothetical protein
LESIFFYFLTHFGYGSSNEARVGNSLNADRHGADWDQIGLKQKTEETQRAKKTKHFALPAAPAADEQNRHRSEQMPSPGKPKNRSSRRAGGTKQQAPGSSGPGSTRRTGLLTKIP